MKISLTLMFNEEISISEALDQAKKLAEKMPSMLTEKNKRLFKVDVAQGSISIRGRKYDESQYYETDDSKSERKLQEMESEIEPEKPKSTYIKL